MVLLLSFSHSNFFTRTFCLFQLQAANQLLQQAQQPYSYLIETVRQRDAQIQSLKERLSQLDEEARCVFRAVVQISVGERNTPSFVVERKLFDMF